jgi:hypothetical protein
MHLLDSSLDLQLQALKRDNLILSLEVADSLIITDKAQVKVDSIAN